MLAEGRVPQLDRSPDRNDARASALSSPKMIMMLGLLASRPSILGATQPPLEGVAVCSDNRATSARSWAFSAASCSSRVELPRPAATVAAVARMTASRMFDVVGTSEQLPQQRRRLRSLRSGPAAQPALPVPEGRS